MRYFSESLKSWHLKSESWGVQDLTGTAWGFATCALKSSDLGVPIVEALGLGTAQRLTQFVPWRRHVGDLRQRKLKWESGTKAELFWYVSMYMVTYCYNITSFCQINPNNISRKSMVCFMGCFVVSFRMLMRLICLCVCVPPLRLRQAPQCGLIPFTFVHIEPIVPVVDFKFERFSSWWFHDFLRIWILTIRLFHRL